MDQADGRDNETIDIHYSDSGGTNNMNFSFITRMSIPVPRVRKKFPIYAPELAFSADGSKFAVAMACGGVSVWDIRSKAPLATFTEVPWPKNVYRPLRYPKFIGENVGKEILVFVEVRQMFTF